MQFSVHTGSKGKYHTKSSDHTAKRECAKFSNYACRSHAAQVQKESTTHSSEITQAQSRKAPSYPTQKYEYKFANRVQFTADKGSRRKYYAKFTECCNVHNLSYHMYTQDRKQVRHAREETGHSLAFYFPEKRP